MCVVCSRSLDNFKFPMLVSISCLLKITKAFVRLLEDIVKLSKSWSGQVSHCFVIQFPKLSHASKAPDLKAESKAVL